MNQIVMARAHRLSGMYTYERAFNSAIESLPLTNMRYRNGWVESVALHRYRWSFFYYGSL